MRSRFWKPQGRDESQNHFLVLTCGTLRSGCGGNPDAEGVPPEASRRVSECRYAVVVLLIVRPVISGRDPSPPPVEIRFCPAAAVHTYPLESRRELNSLMLQNMAVLNRAAAPFKINSIELELLKGDQVLEAKKLDAAALERAATHGMKMQAADELKRVAFQFCGTELIPEGVKLAGPTLDRDQAVLISSQVFAFNGTRDTLRVRVRGTSGGKEVESTGTIPIKSDFAKNTYIFPLRDVSYVGAGATSTRIIAGLSRRSSLSISRASARTASPIAAMAAASKITTPTAPRFSRWPMARSSRLATVRLKTRPR